jgi:hypothetical protein
VSAAVHGAVAASGFVGLSSLGAVARVLHQHLSARRPVAVYATFEPDGPGWLLRQHWHACPTHGLQLVSPTEPGCACPEVTS